MTCASAVQKVTRIPTVPCDLGLNDKKEQGNSGVISRIFNIALDYLKGRDGLSNTAKVCYHVVDWVKQFRSVSPAAQSFRSVNSDVKNVLSFTELFGFVNNFGKKLADLTKVNSAKDMPAAVTDTFLTGTRVVSPICDGLSLANEKKIVNLSPETVHALKLSSYSALAIGTGAESIYSVNKVRDSMDKLNAANTDSDKAHHRVRLNSRMVELAKFVSYFFMGVLGVLAVAFQYTVTPWAILACSTSALLLNIGGYFYNRLNNVDPSKG